MLRSVARFAPLVCLALAAMGCARSDIEARPVDAGTDAPSAAPDAGAPLATTADKIDVLLVVDNTSSLAVAHDLFTSTVPYLLDRLARPACVNGFGNVVATTAAEDEPCPDGQREFAPLRDIHLGVISTSIGGHGADVCSPASPNYNPTQNDKAHLLSRQSGGGVVPTYADRGFLDWDPLQAATPPGDADEASFDAKAAEIVDGAGIDGCGYESQLESIYRFLVDPSPYESIGVVGNNAVAQGVDQVLLQERADFLRPDSALLVLLISDEDDCSTIEGGQYFYSNQLQLGGADFHLPPARSECAVDPDGPCCASCGQPTPEGCPSDPVCQTPALSADDDPANLRCFDQKRRFGVDFLYPVDRYIAAFTQATVTARDGSVVANPLFSGPRSPELVVVGMILGVPWQDISYDPTTLGFGYQRASDVDWGLIVGDAASETPPADPLMISSIDPRSGTDPRTNTPLAPATSTSPDANPINGHERVISSRDDLQYACIYPRPSPIDCASTDQPCDCVGPDLETNPVCQAMDGSYSTTQTAVGALPGTRELRVLQGIGEQAVVASICASETKDMGSTLYAYKPAMDAALRALRPRLAR